MAMVFLVACGSDETTEVQTTIAPPIQEIDETADVLVTVILNTVNLRQKPTMNSAVVDKLPSGSKLLWQGQVSEITAPVKLRGVRYNDPWLYVKTNEGADGWIYAATIEVVKNSQKARRLAQQLAMRRAYGVLGSDMAQQLQQYRENYLKSTDSAGFARAFEEGQELRDQLVKLLEKKAKVDMKAPADMQWLESVMPSYKQVRVAEGTRYYLYADFNKLKEKARQTSGDEDNAFIDLQLLVYPDGVEDKFPVWIKQVSDYQGENLLGKGIYLKIFEQMDVVLRQGSLFEEAVLELKKRMVNDMIASHSKFRESKKARSKEIQEILKDDFIALSDEDKDQLKKLVK
jgi:hypothetical protein